MENKRVHWMDTGRGIAVATTLFVHLMRWLLISFAAWDFTQGTFINFDVGVVRGVEGYLRICWLSVFAYNIILTYRENYVTIPWLLKRFLLLIVAPTVIWMLSTKQAVFQWEIIQSLFVYNILGVFIHQMSTKNRWILYTLTILACILLFPFKDQLADSSLFWAILVGGVNQNNYFNVLYGLPAFYYFYELFRMAYDKEKDELNFKYLYISTFIFSICLAFLWLSGIESIEPRHYPPQLSEYLTAFIFNNCCHIYLFKRKDKINPRGFLTILGRYSWVHFLGHLFLGAIIFEWLGLFKHQLSFWGGFFVVVVMLILLWRINLLILDYKIRRGFDVNQSK